MKKLLLPFFGFILSLNLMSQNKTNLVVFSEDGDKFYLVINGIRQNIQSETNVKVTDLTTENFSFTIIFEDSKIPSIRKTQALPFGNEYTYRIKTDKKGKKVMKYFSETALTAPSNNPGSTTIAYHTTEEIPVTNSTSNGNSATDNNTTGAGNGASSSVSTGGNTTETVGATTTTTNSSEGSTGTIGTTGSGMNIDINVSENGASISVGGTGINSGVGTTTTGGTTTESKTTGGTSTTGTSTTTYSSTTTTTTTTTTSGTGNGAGISTNGATTGGTSTYKGTSNYMCGAAMNSTDFAATKKTVESEGFEDDKYSVAKQVTKGSCLSSAQIKELMELFDFEQTKLDYAKYAYDYCYDKNNYYKLNDAFDFETSVDDLNEYIEKK